MTIVACIIAINLTWAERVSEEEAALVANNFMNVVQPAAGVHRAPAKRMVLKANSESSEPQYYIYENANGEGWVMVAANDVVRPILAYSHTGSFRTDNMPANIKSWLNGYKKQIAYSAQHATQADAKVQREWLRLRSGVRRTTATPIVAPLIKTGWSQDTPYWNLCPTKNDKQCYTGCVATAMAQVMKYWEWPKQGTGSHTIPGTTYSADFGATTYDWANMTNSYSGSSTAAQKTAVATLMYHCGVAVDMSYGTADEGGSGAHTIDWNGYFSGKGKMCAETALKQFFGYKSTVVGYYRDGSPEDGMRSWTRSEWIAMLKSELDAHRPIMYVGVGCDDPNDDETYYGHSFVCDGYNSDSYFHFNFGWSNWCDGYYDVDALVTHDPGSGGGNGEYNLEQDVIVGIEPPQTGHEVIKNATGCTISCANHAKNNETFTVTITPKDASYAFTSLTVQLGSTTLTLNTDYTLSADYKTLTINASALTGEESDDLTITAVWTKNRYLYEFLSDACTPEYLSGDLAITGVSLELTIMPNDGHTLADAYCWDVEMGGEVLTYGTGFTYDESTGAFRIEHVTGDVEIIAVAGRPVTWMANGEVFAANLAFSNIIRLPENEPVACEDKEFIGWTATENYESATTAPVFAKKNDTYSVDTYYAVYATPGEEGTQKMIYLDEDSVSASYGTDTEETRCGITCYYTNVMKSSSGTIQMRKSNSYIANKDNLNKIDSIIINGVTTLTVHAGTSAKPAVTTITRNGNKYDFTGGTYGYFAIRNATSGALYPTSIKIYYSASGGSSYTDYTTSCVAPEPVYYNIRFFDKGVQVGETQSVLKNSQPEVPSDPEACDGYTFVGWWGATLPEDNTTAHTWTTDFTATRDTTYYAIYCRTETEGGENSKIIQLDATEDTTFPKEGITLSVSNGVLNNGTDYRVYKGSTLTITSTVGDMSNIALTYDGSYNGGGWASSYQPNAATWTSPTTTSGSGGKQARITFIEITVGTAPTITTYYSSEGCSSTTDIENTAIVPVAQKLLRNGQIVIIRGEAVYTPTGARIQ